MNRFKKFFNHPFFKKYRILFSILFLVLASVLAIFVFLLFFTATINLRAGSLSCNTSWIEQKWYGDSLEMNMREVAKYEKVASDVGEGMYVAGASFLFTKNGSYSILNPYYSDKPNVLEKVEFGELLDEQGDNLDMPEGWRGLGLKENVSIIGSNSEWYLFQSIACPRVTQSLGRYDHVDVPLGDCYMNLYKYTAGALEKIDIPEQYLPFIKIGNNEQINIDQFVNEFISSRFVNEKKSREVENSIINAYTAGELLLNNKGIEKYRNKNSKRELGFWWGIYFDTKDGFLLSFNPSEDMWELIEKGGYEWSIIKHPPPGSFSNSYLFDPGPFNTGSAELKDDSCTYVNDGDHNGYFVIRKDNITDVYRRSNISHE